MCLRLEEIIFTIMTNTELSCSRAVYSYKFIFLCLFLLEGGFRAIVTLKGEDFDFSSEGELRLSPREARESAAALILVKLRKTAVQAN